jgi:hypothetical protein
MAMSACAWKWKSSPFSQYPPSKEIKFVALASPPHDEKKHERKQPRIHTNTKTKTSGV